MNRMNKILLFILMLPLATFAQSPQVKTCEGKEINLSSISVSSDAGTINTSSCQYTPGDLLSYLNCVAANNPLPTGSELKLSFGSAREYLNGVSTLDQVLIARHIINVKRFDKAANTLAADLDGNNKVNIRDIVLLRQLILGQITELSVPDWQFYKSNNLTLGGIGLDTELTFNIDEFPLTELSIIGVKIGDVNGSAIP